MMKEIEAEFLNSGFLASEGGKLELSCKGLKTLGYTNPTMASALFLDIDQDDAKSASGYSKLKDIIDRLVSECLKRGLATLQDLAFNRIEKDKSSGKYIVKRLNASIISTKKG